MFFSFIYRFGLVLLFSLVVLGCRLSVCVMPTLSLVVLAGTCWAAQRKPWFFGGVAFVKVCTFLVWWGLLCCRFVVALP